jgi:hypothetical protein
MLELEIGLAILLVVSVYFVLRHRQQLALNRLMLDLEVAEERRIQATRTLERERADREGLLRELSKKLEDTQLQRDQLLTELSSFTQGEVAQSRSRELETTRQAVDSLRGELLRTALQLEELALGVRKAGISRFDYISGPAADYPEAENYGAKLFQKS